MSSIAEGDYFMTNAFALKSWLLFYAESIDSGVISIGEGHSYESRSLRMWYTMLSWAERTFSEVNSSILSIASRN